MELDKTQKFKIGRIAEKFQLKLIAVFGSFANGKQREDSDLDIAVLCKKDVSFSGQIHLINELSSILGREVDLSFLNKANPLLLFQISKNSKLLYGSKEDFLKFRLYAFKLYNDYAPYFEMERKLNKRIIKHL